MRLEGSAAAGMGHATRCLALAQQLRARGATVELVARAPTGAALPALAEAAGATLRELAAGAPDWEADAAQTLAIAAAGDRPAWVVVDHYGLDARWERRLRDRCERVAVIDDLADRDHDCDLLVDQNFHPDPAARYRGRLPRGCSGLFGPRYALLRTTYAASRAAQHRRDGGLRRALVSYGGSDAGGETLKAIEGIRQAGIDGLAADVLIGPGNPHAARIREQCATLPGSRVHETVTDLAPLMARADIALGAGGVTMWERSALGLPGIVTAIADNQAPSSAAMGEAGLCVYLGASAEATPARIADALRGLAAAPALVRHLSAACGKLVDGQGARRVADAMAGAGVALRRATAEDCDPVFAWRNHPSVRAMSLDGAELDLARHREWFAAALRDGSRDLLVIESAGRPTGMLRFDASGETVRVSIFLDPSATGRGTGAAALRQGAAWLREHRPGIRRIEAEVLAHNDASLHAFANAGFAARRQLLERPVHDA